MKVFLSWSGEISKQVAVALRDWLPNVIQALEPWMSAEDIEKGARWSSDVASELEDSKAGILCITPDNLDAPWLNFEAGALSKTIEKTFVCPYLMGLQPHDLKGPLVQFQAAESTEKDTRELVKTLNGALSEHKLPEPKLDETFDVWWPKLQSSLAEIDSTKVARAPQRSQREMIEEILALLREQAKKPNPAVYVDLPGKLEYCPLTRKLVEQYFPPTSPDFLPPLRPPKPSETEPDKDK